MFSNKVIIFVLQSRGLTILGRENMFSPWLFFLFISLSNMYLLYADESGSVGDMSQQHFILAGICMYERQSFWLANEMDKIAARFNPADPNTVELHGSPMYGGRKFWRAFSREARHDAIADCLKLFAASNISNRVFAVIIKKSLISPLDPVEYAFEQLSSRFDLFFEKTSPPR